jgi:predicted membrane-bound spermidine synthase
MISRWNKNTLICLSLFLLSASMLSFEIVSTRIASVIFVQDYAFIILSLALLGLGAGGVFSYYRMKGGSDPSRMLSRVLAGLGASMCVFIAAAVVLSITSPFIFFFLLVIPFFCGGVAYAQIYKAYSALSFILYASDLSGAAVGSIASLGLISTFGASNSILCVALVALTVSAFFLHDGIPRGRRTSMYVGLGLCFAALFWNGRNDFLGMVPIGHFPEKDFYYVYPDAPTTSQIIDSRWSIYGRADLVEYRYQDEVRQLFIDGAAGSQVYRFNGNLRNTQSMLQELLLHHTNAIPFLCMQKSEKRSMLVIGPGGGKDVLLGLFGEADTITGVEVNPDFVKIVNDHKAFDGGIYSDFPNVKIVIEEGRHFVKRSRSAYDLLVMALPSTAQTQNIEPFATSENYLLSKEAIADYLAKLTPEGRMILTVHNEWELLRLITTAVSVFHDLGVPGENIKNHFAVFEAEYAPSVVIKKNAFTADETQRWKTTCTSLPRGYPAVTYLPFGMIGDDQSLVNRFLVRMTQSSDRVSQFVRASADDVSPCTDDRPYFYKRNPGIPAQYQVLLVGTVVVNILALWLPFRLLSRKTGTEGRGRIAIPLMLFACLGAGFMVVEVSLFQKLVLYLGSPTISLSILLSSLLVGMGTGSYCSRNFFGANARKRLRVASLAVVFFGILLFAVFPLILSKGMELTLPWRATTTFLLLFPLAFVMGIPFPSSLQLVTMTHGDRFIPWMYGLNGAMSVLGSVLAVVLSMLFGFTPAYFVGLASYAGIFALALVTTSRAKISPVV